MNHGNRYRDSNLISAWVQHPLFLCVCIYLIVEASAMYVCVHQYYLASFQSFASIPLVFLSSFFALCLSFNKKTGKYAQLQNWAVIYLGALCLSSLLLNSQ
jgi:hypothetical protein